jgi:hypothetical protein
MQQAFDEDLIHQDGGIVSVPNDTYGGGTGGGSSDPVKDDPNDPYTPPPTEQSPPVGGGEDYSNPSLDELYPEAGETAVTPGVDYVAPTGADVAEIDRDDFAQGPITNADGVDQAAVDRGYAAAAGVGAGQSSNMNVDEDLARIMQKDSPLLAQARAEANRFSNKRGLLNSSMAAGENYGRQVTAGLTMAQQNSAQRSQQSIANSQNRTQASIASAQMANQMAMLEAQLGIDVSKFNADQLNQAERLTQELNAAAASNDAAAYNAAQIQLANLERDAQAQATELNYTAGAETAAAQNARDISVMEQLTQLNTQYLANEGAADVENIRGTYQQTIAATAAGASAYNTMMDALSRVMSDPTMTPEQINKAINVITTTGRSSLAMIEEMSGMTFDGGGGGGSGSGGGGYNPGNNVAGSHLQLTDQAQQQLTEQQYRDMMTGLGTM